MMRQESEICICSTNPHKRAECERIVGLTLTPVALDLDEIQHVDPEIVCADKVKRAYAALGKPVLVDDTGLGLKALGGFPGALVTWLLEGCGNEAVHRLLAPGSDPTAEAVTCIGFADSDGAWVFTGRLSGRVIGKPRGEFGFGFDPIFIPEGEDRTLAEMSNAEKDSVSPRGEALRAFAQFLDSSAYQRNLDHV